MKKVKLEVPSGTWLSHNGEIKIIPPSCNICGDELDKRSIEGRCWKCWRNLNPGALSQ